MVRDRTPEQSFQKGCEGVTADDSLREDGSINVLNRCRKPDGRVDEARGRAKVVDKVSGAKLKVSFSGHSMATIGFSIMPTTIAGQLWESPPAAISGSLPEPRRLRRPR